MKIYVLHSARLEPYTDNEYDSYVYGAFTSYEKASAKRDWFSQQPRGPYYANISEIEVDMT
jgi:hypothetical protein